METSGASVVDETFGTESESGGDGGAAVACGSAGARVAGTVGFACESSILFV